MNIFDLKNKTALITGGTGWLGFEFCKILALNNANIINTINQIEINIITLSNILLFSL